MSDVLGADLLANWQDMVRLLSLLALDVAIATLIIRGVYFRRYRNREYVLTYYAFNVITFCLCLLLSRVQRTQFGVALALFGVFGILRYRTEQIRIRDLTYLFIVIAIGVLNGLASRRVSLAELLLVDGVIVTMIALLERGASSSGERTTVMLYDQIELLRPGNEARLLADLALKTGLHAVRVNVDRFDLLRDAAEITVISRDERAPHPVRSLT